MSEHNPWCRGNRPRSPRERVERDRILYGTGILRVFPWGAEARIPPDEVYIHSNLPAPGSDALAAAHAELTRLQSRIRELESAGGEDAARIKAAVEASSVSGWTMLDEAERESSPELPLTWEDGFDYAMERVRASLVARGGEGE